MGAAFGKVQDKSVVGLLTHCRDPEQFTMGAEQSTPRETTTETATMQNIVPAPAAARVGKTELNPKTKEQLTVTLADINVNHEQDQKWTRKPIGGSSTPSDEISEASTRSSAPVSFRVSKTKRKQRLGVSLHSGSPGCEGVVITSLQDGAIRGVGARLGDKVISIGGTPVEDAYHAAELLKNAVGDIEVVVERVEEEDAKAALANLDSSRSSVPLSFRISKNKRKESLGVTLHSDSPGCDGVVITGLQNGGMRGVGARLGDKVISIGGSPVKHADEAADLLKKAVGDVEVVVERMEEDEETQAALAA